MDHQVSELVRDAARLCILGRDGEALAKLSAFNGTHLSVLSPQEKRAIASGKFNCLYRMGYYKRAETVVRKALAISSEQLCNRRSPEEIWMHALLRAKRAVVMLKTTGRLAYVKRIRTELTGLFLESSAPELQTNPILVQKSLAELIAD